MLAVILPRQDQIKTFLQDNRLQIAALSAVLVMAAAFGVWFTGRQLAMVDPGMVYSYPWHIRLISVFEVTMVVTAGYLLTTILFRALAPRDGGGRLALLALATWSPLLVAIFFGNFSLAAKSVIVAVTVGSIGLAAFRATDWLTPRFLLHALALLLITVITAVMATMVSPLMQSAPLTVYGSTSQGDLHVIAPIYKSFIWAKFFSFSDMDYSAWAGVPTVPTNLRSFPMQLATLIFDLPSIDVKEFHRIVSAVVFLIFVFGAFGFYLLLHVGLAVRFGVSVIISSLYILGNSFFITSFNGDYLFFVSSYALLPYALLGLNVAIRHSSFKAAAWTGGALAAPFYILAPHPEAAMHAMFFFSCTALVWLLPITGGGSFPRRLALMCVMALTAAGLSLAHLLPIVDIAASRNAIVFGHLSGIFYKDPPTIQLNTYYPLGYLTIYFGAFAILLQWLRRTVSSEFLAGVIVTSIILAILIPYETGPIADFLRWLDLPIYFIAPHRVLMYPVLTSWIIIALGVEGFIKGGEVGLERLAWLRPAWTVLRQRLMVLFTLIGYGVAIAVVITWIDPIKELTSKTTRDNPEKCEYYVSLRANLANVAGLEKDPRNTAFLRDRLVDFERRVQYRSGAAPEYADRYRKALSELGVSTASDLPDAMVLGAVKRLAPIVDEARFDTASGACVYKPIVSGGNEYVKRVLRFNNDALYAELPSPFMRIVGATGRTSEGRLNSFAFDTPKAGEAPRSNDSHLGLGPGLFINNATTSLDSRFMMGYPLLHALYLYPNYLFAKKGTYVDLVAWKLDAREVLEPTARRLLNIAGVDVITVREEDLELGLDFEGLHPLSTKVPSAVDPHYVPLVNDQSYGMAYLATDVTSVSPQSIAEAESQVKAYFKRQLGIVEYKKVVQGLQQILLSMKGERPAVVEVDEGVSLPKGSGLEGKVLLKGVVGARAFMESDCPNETCLLVFNQAAMPGWRVYVDGARQPVLRTNLAFLGVQVPQGVHEVSFVYMPTSEIVGDVVSLGVFVLMLTAIGYGARGDAKSLGLRFSLFKAQPMAEKHSSTRNYLPAFLATLFIVLLFLLPNFFGKEVLYFSGDGAVGYFTFKWIYSSLLESWSFPIWNFSMLYGQAMEYAYIAIGPTKYISMFIGAIFGITNSWVLFHAAAFMDIAILAMGVFLIARHFDFEPKVALLITLGLALRTYWHIEHYFIHHYFTIFPILIYFAIRFAETVDFRILAWAGLFMAISFFDGALYMPLLIFYQFALLTILLILMRGSHTKFLQSYPSLFHPTTLIIGAGAIVLAAIWVMMVQGIWAGELLAYRNGRSVNSTVNFPDFVTQLNLIVTSFISFLGMPDFKRGAGFFTVAGPVAVFFIYYTVGLLLTGASFRGRSHAMAFLMLGAATLFATLGNSGGIFEYFAKFYYLLPGMWTYRFGIGFYSLGVVLVALAGMIGFNAFLTQSAKFRSVWINLLFLVLLACVVFVSVYANLTARFFWSETPLVDIGNMKEIGGVIAAIMMFLLFVVVISHLFSIVKREPSFKLRQRLFGYFYSRIFAMPLARGVVRGGVLPNVIFAVLLIANLLVLTRIWYIDSYVSNGDATAHNSVIEATKHVDVRPTLLRRNDAIYEQLYFFWMTGRDNAPSFSAKSIDAVQQAKDPKALLQGMQTSANTLFLSGQHLYTCTPWLDTVTSSSEIENFFRYFAGATDSYIRGLILGVTAGDDIKERYEMARWIEEDAAARRLLGCDENIVRLGRGVVSTRALSDAAEVLKEFRGERDVITLGPTDEDGVLPPAKFGRTAGTVDTTRYGGNEIRFTVDNDSSDAAWVIVTDVANKRWQATVNDVETPIYLANLSFKAVIVPPGHSEVVMKYSSPWSSFRVWSAALLLSVVTLGAWLYGLVHLRGLPVRRVERFISSLRGLGSALWAGKKIWISRGKR